MVELQFWLLKTDTATGKCLPRRVVGKGVAHPEPSTGTRSYLCVYNCHSLVTGEEYSSAPKEAGPVHPEQWQRHRLGLQGCMHALTLD